jgi:hypothetical protein
MKKLYQVQVEVTYNYKIVVDDENENLVAEDVIDEVMFDNPKGDQIDFSIREIKIRPDLKGSEELYNYDGSIDDLVEEYYQEKEQDEDEEESNKPIKPLEGQGELFE